MTKFSIIRIIYNPKSTGDSKKMALTLSRQLRKELDGTDIKCLPTEYAGHARVLACEIAKHNNRPLIISSSGDGGYNEVVNGVMKSGNKQAVCAVLPAGNANDHSRTMQKKPLLEEILKGKVTRLDLIEVTVKSEGGTLKRYAHSYAGLGITPAVGLELNKHELNKFNELVLALKTFGKFKPFEITRRGNILKLDSLLFGNINQMAKVLTIAPKNKPADGLFEVVMFKSGPKTKLIKRLAKAAIKNLETVKRQRVYKFEIVKKLPMQLDGEIIKLPVGAAVTVKSAHKALATII